MNQELYTTKPAGRGCGRTLKGCAVVAGIICIGLIVLLVYLSRLPVVKDMVACRENMVEIGEALQRYRDVNGFYPPSIEVLSNEYLQNAAVLRCPQDKTAGPVSGYIYHMPSPDAPDEFVVLECKRHLLAPDKGYITLKLHVDSSVDMTSPVLPAKGSSSPSE